MNSKAHPKRWLIAARRLTRKGVLSLLASSQIAFAVQTETVQSDASVAAPPSNASVVTVQCRTHAFFDAIKLMNSAMRSIESLQQATAPIALAELNSILSVAIRQASDEYHCARGTLSAGFDSSYAHTLKRAHAHALAHRLPPDVARTAATLATQIESTGAPRPRSGTQ